MPQPEPIEIKVNIAGDVDKALSALRLGDGQPREVWFLEDLTEGARPALPLLNAGIVLRLRRRRKNGGKTKEDSTVKLRPCRRSQLVGPWNRPLDPDYRIEGDWSRSRRVLAASHGADLDSGAIGRALDGGEIADVFTDQQRAFLAASADIGVALSGVTALKPIAAVKWEGISVGDVHEAVNQVVAERWTVAGLDFLELSIRVETGELGAAAAQQKLTKAVESVGLVIDDGDESKTARVMKRLAGLD